MTSRKGVHGCECCIGEIINSLEKMVYFSLFGLSRWLVPISLSASRPLNHFKIIVNCTRQQDRQKDTKHCSGQRPNTHMSLVHPAPQTHNLTTEKIMCFCKFIDHQLYMRLPQLISKSLSRGDTWSHHELLSGFESIISSSLANNL